MLVTALVTPFRDGGRRLDTALLQRLLTFQVEQGVQRVLLAGTTGEGAALTDDERLELMDAALDAVAPERLMVALGAGRLEDVIHRGRAAQQRGIRDLLLADCPYSGASSMALRTTWHGPVAQALPEARLYPYAVPGRTGTELLPDDLARLVEDHPNVVGVKDATGRLARMERVRSLCGADFVLLCGDDQHLRNAMIDPAIRAHGGCSVVSNLVPAAMARLVAVCRDGQAVAARQLQDALAGLFGLVAVTTDELVELDGSPVAVPQRARNPAPLKDLLLQMGVLETGCRPPLARLGLQGQRRVRELLAGLWRVAPEHLQPLGATFGVDLEDLVDSTDELLQGAW